MSLPTDPKMTKLRLQYERALREYEETQSAAYKLVKPSREAFEKINAEYHLEWHKRGYCSECCETLTDCKCIWLAGDAMTAPRIQKASEE